MEHGATVRRQKGLFIFEKKKPKSNTRPNKREEDRQDEPLELHVFLIDWYLHQISTKRHGPCSRRAWSVRVRALKYRPAYHSVFLMMNVKASWWKWW
jgi:hypothetical protein